VKLVEILQGKWLGHPLHSALVHLPVGSWIAACLLDVTVTANWIREDAARLSMYCVGFGLLGALIAVAPGLADWSQIKREKPAWKLGLYHMILNVGAVAVWVVNFALRLKADELVTATILATSLLGTGLVIVSGYLGSRMVFDHGTSVARESKKQWREIARSGGSTIPEEK
jgi:uncharacterized membrane protein